MRNDGFMPMVERVDIKFRNGIISRGVDPTLMRWAQIPDGPSSYDITDWQTSKPTTEGDHQ